jgi:heptosyltransferase II
MTIAVFLPNWIGDVAMATPALRALRNHFVGYRLVGVLRPHLVGLLGGNPWFDELWTCDSRWNGGAGGRWDLVRRMRREPCDRAILLPNSFQTALLAWLGGARQRIGYARSGRSLLLTKRLRPEQGPRRQDLTPMVDYYLKVAQAVGCLGQSQRLELHTTPSEEQVASEAFARLGLRRDGRIVVLNGGAAYGSAKTWPASHMAQLAQRIVDHLDHDVLVYCGPNEQDTATDIVNQAGRLRVFSMADLPIGLGLAKAYLARARLVVSTDSGPRHVAAAMGRPLVTLLGPTPREVIANPTVRDVILRQDLGCMPCRQRTCPLQHHRCMIELSVDMVFAAVIQSLSGEGGRSAKCA